MLLVETVLRTFNHLGNNLIISTIFRFYNCDFSTSVSKFKGLFLCLCNSKHICIFSHFKFSKIVYNNFSQNVSTLCLNIEILIYIKVSVQSDLENLNCRLYLITSNWIAEIWKFIFNLKRKNILHFGDFSRETISFQDCKCRPLIGKLSYLKGFDWYWKGRPFQSLINNSDPLICQRFNVSLETQTWVIQLVFGKL